MALCQLTRKYTKVVLSHLHLAESHMMLLYQSSLTKLPMKENLILLPTYTNVVWRHRIPQLLFGDIQSVGLWHNSVTDSPVLGTEVTKITATDNHNSPAATPWTISAADQWSTGSSYIPGELVQCDILYSMKRTLSIHKELKWTWMTSVHSKPDTGYSTAVAVRLKWPTTAYRD